MANKTQLAPLNTIVPVGGTRIRSRLLNGMRTWVVKLTVRATVDVAVAPAGALRNRGSAFALFDEIGIEENGEERVRLDGRMLRFMSEFFAPSALTSVRAATPIATYLLEESAYIYFAHPLSVAPQETVFRERDARQQVDVFVRMFAAPSAALNARLFTVGGATVTISAVSVTVSQEFDARSAELPVFIPTMRMVQETIAGANTQLPIFLKSPHFLRGVFIQQDTDEGEATDILSALALRGDFRHIIGPNQQGLDDLQHYGEFEAGGAVLGSQAYLGLNFQKSGKLSNVINPSDDVNLRIEANVTPGAGTNPVLRIALMELERVQGLVTDEIPYPI
jgi:hypothetical protein